jgi:hypothetical protein
MSACTDPFFALDEATKTLKRVEVYFYFFFNLGARWGVGVNATPRSL